MNDWTEWFLGSVIALTFIIVLSIPFAVMHDNERFRKQLAECEAKGGTLVQWTEYKTSKRGCVKKEAIL